jgi:hypothetical protein
VFAREYVLRPSSKIVHFSDPLLALSASLGFRLRTGLVEYSVSNIPTASTGGVVTAVRPLPRRIWAHIAVVHADGVASVRCSRARRAVCCACVSYFVFRLCHHHYVWHAAVCRGGAASASLPCCWRRRRHIPCAHTRTYLCVGVAASARARACLAAPFVWMCVCVLVRTRAGTRASLIARLCCGVLSRRPTAQLYIDGGLVASARVAQPLAAARKTMYIGIATDFAAKYAKPQHFDGLVDEFRLWSTDRALVDIRAYRSYLPPSAYTPDLMIYFNFDNDTGIIEKFTLDNTSLSTVVDLSPNRRASSMVCIHTTACRVDVNSDVGVCGDGQRSTRTEAVSRALACPNTHVHAASSQQVLQNC